MASRKTGLRALAAAATIWVLLVVARAGEVVEAAGGRGEDGDVAQLSTGDAVAGYVLSNRHFLSVGGDEAGAAGAVQLGGRRALLATTKDDLKKKKEKDCKDKTDKKKTEDDKEKRKKSIVQKKEELKKKSPPGRSYFKKIRSKWFPAPSHKAPKPAAKSPPPPHNAPAPSHKSPKPAAKSPPPPHSAPAPSYKTSGPSPSHKPLSTASVSRYLSRYPRSPRTPSPPPPTVTTPTPSPPPPIETTPTPSPPPPTQTTPTPSPPPVTSTPSPTATQKAWLDPHNVARAKKSLPALTWDTTLESYALDWANHQKTTGNCALVHSHGPYGENLFWGYGKVWTPADAVASWVGEEQYYDYATNTCASGQMCGHYTQVMWKTSLRLGCAQVTCNDASLFFICSYDPPGNYIGQKPY